jgi:hypothetical protein
MNSTRGNLAFKEDYHNRPRSRAAVARSSQNGMVVRKRQNKQSALPKLRVRRVSAEQTVMKLDYIKQQERAISRDLAIQRLVSLSGIILVIALVASVYGVIVYRQASILEENFANVRIERTISKLDQESNQISEALAQKTNLDLIRRRAINELGLQDPARSQVISVFVPDTDRVVYASANAGAADREAYLNNVFTNVEGFFKTLNQRRQVD